MKEVHEISEFCSCREPFAAGYLSSKHDDTEFKIASGMLESAKKMPVFIRDGAYFAGCLDAMEEVGVRYTYGGGIQVNKEYLLKEIEEYPEHAEELTYILETMLPLDTNSMLWECQTPTELILSEMKACWGGTWGGHSNPDYHLLLHKGTNGLRKRIEQFRSIHTDRTVFYDALSLALDAVDTIALRYREFALDKAGDAHGEEQKRLLRIARALENVPANPPKDFFEACQMFWMVFIFDGIDSPGRFDISLIDYYRLSGETDRRECLEELWKLFYETRTWNLCISGSDEFGNDQTNELSYAILEVARKYCYHTPNLTVRIHRNTPEALWESIASTIAKGIGMPVIYNDDCVCPALEALGIPASDSHNYCMNGCNQIDIFGKSHMGLEDGEVCLAKCLEFTLLNGVCSICGETIGLQTGDPREFKDFQELMDAYKKQVEYITDVAINMSNKCQKLFATYAPNPHRSNLIQGCVEKGVDYKSGGPIYGHGQILAEGIADTADSLIAIRHYVFEERKYSMEELIEALQCNFEGKEQLYYDFSNYHKFGNDIEDVDGICREITEHFNRYLLTKETFRGGRYGGGCSPFSRVASYGEKIGALPNGKKKGDPILADSIGAVPGFDEKGPTALINSVLKMNHFLAKSGFILNLKFSKKLFTTDKGISVFIDLAKTYFMYGGQQLSVAVLSAEELLDAQKHPEKHRNLIVRVGGYSDYFNNLTPELQDNIIKRTELPV